MLNIRKRLSTKLTLGIMLLAAPIFILALGVLYTQSRHIIREEAVGHANSMLNKTTLRVCRWLSAVENATNANSWLIMQNLQPDSLLSLTRRIVSTNPHIDGCSISMEPDFFPPTADTSPPTPSGRTTPSPPLWKSNTNTLSSRGTNWHTT